MKLAKNVCGIANVPCNVWPQKFWIGKYFLLINWLMSLLFARKCRRQLWLYYPFQILSHSHSKHFIFREEENARLLGMEKQQTLIVLLIVLSFLEYDALRLFFVLWLWPNIEDGSAKKNAFIVKIYFLSFIRNRYSTNSKTYFHFDYQTRTYYSKRTCKKLKCSELILKNGVF